MGSAFCCCWNVFFHVGKEAGRLKVSESLQPQSRSSTPVQIQKEFGGEKGRGQWRKRGRVWKGRLPGEKRCVPPDSACKSGIPLSRTSHSAAVLGLPEAPSHGSNPGQSLGSSLYKSGGCSAEMDQRFTLQAIFSPSKELVIEVK